MIWVTMKAGLIFIFIFLIFINQLTAQRKCSTVIYQQEEIRNNPSLAGKVDAIETFTRQQIATTNNSILRRNQENIIKIPIVVHILYHQPSENISDEQVFSQIAALNRDFRRKSADTANTPAVFKSLAADCEIEFQLATSDPKRKSTNGIIHKYTPIVYWQADDKMKFSVEMGDNAWDAKSYLNIWVCNLEQVAGYSSIPGGPDNKDGVVIGFPVFGTIGTMSGFDMGKTAVHEVGHWLNLKHTWGDTDCGDDLVDDTPKQRDYNQGCPSGVRISCSNGPNGDMYMNYMDFVNDACMNLFTKGQKERMRALFIPGGIRNAILSSTGLSQPLILETLLPDEPPKWLHPQLYPNPATTEMTLDIAYDIRWLSKMINVTNLQGQIVMQMTITSKNQKIDIRKLPPGMYFMNAKKEDGDFIRQKFIKF
jgi:hypothetical protein